MRGLTPQQQIIAELDAATERVDAAIAGLNDEQASRPAVDGLIETGRKQAGL